MIDPRRYRISVRGNISDTGEAIIVGEILCRAWPA